MTVFAMNIPVNYPEEKRQALYTQIMDAFDRALRYQSMDDMGLALDEDEYTEEELAAHADFQDKYNNGDPKVNH